MVFWFVLWTQPLLAFGDPSESLGPAMAPSKVAHICARKSRSLDRGQRSSGGKQGLGTAFRSALMCVVNMAGVCIGGAEPMIWT